MNDCQSEITATNAEQVLAERGCLDPAKLDKSLERKREFMECLDYKTTSPGFSTHSDFPFDEVCQRLDGDLEALRPDVDRSKDDAWKAVAILLSWCLKKKTQDQRALKTVAIRFIAATWVLQPQVFGGTSANMVAKSFGISDQNFSRITAAFSRVFRVQNRFQKHDWQNHRHQIISP